MQGLLGMLDNLQLSNLDLIPAWACRASLSSCDRE